jgi:hypothetical protein
MLWLNRNGNSHEVHPRNAYVASGNSCRFSSWTFLGNKLGSGFRSFQILKDSQLVELAGQELR